MTADVWGKLWDIATGDPEGDATIIPVTDDPGSVLLTWPDGSEAWLYWHAGNWQFAEGLNTSCPGDVAARDTL